MPVGSGAAESRLRSKIGTRDASDVDMHANQLTVAVETVRKLVDEQFPEWRALPIRAVASQGTVNALFRIGDKFLARFPLEAGDVGPAWRRLQSEAQAARELLGRTRFATPEPVALGEPGAGTRFRGRCRPGCRGLWPRTRTRANPPRLHMTWLSSSTVCARSALAAGNSADGAGEATCDPTTRGPDLLRAQRTAAGCSPAPAHLGNHAGPPRSARDVMTHGDLIPGNVLVSDGLPGWCHRRRWHGTG